MLKLTVDTIEGKPDSNSCRIHLCLKEEHLLKFAKACVDAAKNDEKLYLGDIVAIRGGPVTCSIGFDLTSLVTVIRSEVALRDGIVMPENRPCE